MVLDLHSRMYLFCGSILSQSIESEKEYSSLGLMTIKDDFELIIFIGTCNDVDGKASPINCSEIEKIQNI